MIKAILTLVSLLVAWLIHIWVVPWLLVSLGFGGRDTAIELAESIPSAVSTSVAIIALYRTVKIQRVRTSVTAKPLGNTQLALILHVSNEYSERLVVEKVILDGLPEAQPVKKSRPISPGKGKDIEYKVSLRPLGRSEQEQLYKRHRLKIIIEYRNVGSIKLMRKKTFTSNPYRN